MIELILKQNGQSMKLPELIKALIATMEPDTPYRLNRALGSLGGSVKQGYISITNGIATRLK
jgi:hypothetical protein